MRVCVIGLSLVGVVFFFSSRRRHTRLQGDWSSDVCSSDLEVMLLMRAQQNRIAAHRLVSRMSNREDLLAWHLSAERSNRRTLRAFRLLQFLEDRKSVV